MALSCPKEEEDENLNQKSLFAVIVEVCLRE